MNKHQQKTTDLTALIRPAVEALDYELLGIELQKQGSNSLIRVYIDSDAGIVVQDCEQVSVQVSGVLEVEDPISGHYTLEVSSPGIDRPLFEKAHYQKFIGDRASIKLENTTSGQKNFAGIIKEVTECDVILQVDNANHILSFANIKSARLVPKDIGKEHAGDT